MVDLGAVLSYGGGRVQKGKRGTAQGHTRTTQSDGPSVQRLKWKGGFRSFLLRGRARRLPADSEQRPSEERRPRTAHGTTTSFVMARNPFVSMTAMYTPGATLLPR